MLRHDAPAGDTDAQALWRSTQARILARRSEIAAAIDLGLEAVTMRRETDAPVDLIDALVDYQDVLQFAGRADEADEAIAEARALAVRKGDVVTAERLAERLGTPT